MKFLIYFMILSNHLIKYRFIINNMARIKRKWDLISEEKRNESIEEIIEFFNNERNEKIGIIAAENILEHFLQTVGLEIYNKGIGDSIDYLNDRIEDIKLDMETLLIK